MMSVNIGLAYEPPPVPDSMTMKEMRDFLNGLKPEPPPPVSHTPWAKEQKEIFSQMLYEAGLNDGNWDREISRPGLKLMTDCIASYYSEQYSFSVALEYYQHMPEAEQKEFVTVLSKCFYFAKHNQPEII
jgi:hypothetical protein